MAGFKEYQMLFQLNANLGSNYSSTFSSGSKAITDLQNKIEGLNRTQSDIAAFEKQQKAVDSCKTKMELYATQLDNLKNATANTSVEEAKLANEIAAKEVQLQKATTAYDNANAKLSDMGQKLRDAGVDTSNLSAEEARLAQEAQNAAQEQADLATESEEMAQSFKTAMEGAAAAIEAAGILTGLKKIYDALSECSGAAMEFETAMAGVKRTVGGDDEFIDSLGESFKELSTSIPITANELASIATTAGQLGIPQQNVEAFTTVMAQLGTTTDLTADNAATMLAQFSNITGVTDYERLGSTVAQLGDATATTASKVVDMSQGMAASASIAGMSATDILAISAAVGSLGIEAQAGSTAMSTLISTLYKATETGDNLEAFASVAGMSADEFKDKWGRDAVGAMNDFIQGLNDTERNGRSAVVILDELGIKNVRQTKAILGLAQAGDLLSNTVQSANEAWSSNTALAEKAGIMYSTTEAKMTMMQNAANNVKVAIGDALNPALSAAAEGATQLLQPIAEFLEQNPALVQGIVAFIGVLGTVAAAITTYTAVTKLAAAASALFAGAIPGVGIILGVAAAIGTLVAVVSALSGPTETTAEKMASLNTEYDALMDDIENQQNIIDLCDRYAELSEEVDTATGSINELVKAAEDEIDVKAHVFDPIDPSQFVTGDTVQLKPGQASYLAANDFLTGAQVKLTPQQASYLASKEFLTDTTVKITPEQAKQLQSWQFLYSTQVQLTPEQKKLLKSAEFIDGTTTITLTAEQATKLAAAGFMDGTTVELTASQANELAAAGFLEDTTVQLTPEAKESLEASVFMKDTNVDLTADITNIADLEKQIAGLAEKADLTNRQLTYSKSVLSDMQKEYDALEVQMTKAKDKKTKSKLQEEMDDLSESIENQQTKISSLEETYDYLNGKYEAAVKVSNDLKAAQDELSATGDALIAASEGRITSLETETEALNKQLEAEKALATVRQAESKQKATENLKEQSKAYADALADYTANIEKYQEAQDKLLSLTDENVLGLRLRNTFTEIQEALDLVGPEGWNLSTIQELREQFEELYSLASGGEWDGNFTSFQQIKDAMRNLQISTEDVTNAQVLLGQEMTETGNAAQAAATVMQTYIDNAVDMVTKGGASIDEVREIMETAFAGYENGAQIVDEAMAQVEEAVNSMASTAEDASGSVDELSQSMREVEQAKAEAQSALDALETELDELRTAYQEAYQSAYDSIDKQIGLFDQISIKTTTSVDQMIKSLQSQAQYMDEYAANLQEAARMGIDEGLLKALSDGSTQSAAYLAEIVKNGAGKMTELNEAFRSVEEGKNDFAEIVAEMETNFSETSASIQAEKEALEASLNGMDASAAGTALGSTLAAGIRSKIEEVKKAAAELRAAATVDTGTGPASTSVAVNKNVTMAYASGTKNAKRGLALVGEEGPELMWMNGGETIATAEETARMARQASVEASPLSAVSKNNGNMVYKIEVKPEYNFSGTNMNEDELQRIMDQNTRNLRNQVERILNDIQSDKARSVYA